MSDMESMAATRASPCSPITSTRASPEPSRDTSTSRHRSLSPVERSSKRRRTDSAFPEVQASSSSFNHVDDDIPMTYSSPRLRPHSAPDLHVPINGAGSFEPQPRTFLGHDREFISHILSIRGVRRPGRATIQRHPRARGFHSELEDLPVISADNKSFIGWREKVDTWPVQKGRGIQRSSTFPQ